MCCEIHPSRTRRYSLADCERTASNSPRRSPRRASMACGATPDEMLAIHNELSRQRSMKLMEHGILDAEHCTQCVESDFRIMAALSAGMVVAGCLCQIPHELMNSRDKGCGDLVSLVEYIAGVSLSAPSAFRNTFRVKLHHHALLATLGLAYAFFTNLSLASNLPTSVFVALKNGTLATNLVVGAVVLRKSYSLAQYVAVVVVTLGLVSTAVQARFLLGEDNVNTKEEDETTTTTGEGYFIGVACLIAALFSRALSGAVQERAMPSAASVSEMIFMRNAIGLPFFILRADGVRTHLRRWIEDPSLGSQWVFLALNVIFDYCCKILMSNIIARRGALNASLVLSFQKFTAFTISVIFLNPILRNSPTVWLGATSVLLGTVAYSFTSTCTRKDHDANKKKDA